MTCHSAYLDPLTGTEGGMVQVDVFWSYGIGAGFALAAARQLRQAAAAGGDGGDGGLLGDRYFTATLLYVGVLFAPSGVWLLWGFPSWETMHAGDRALPAWLVAAFALTNVTQGALGYAITKRLILRGRPRLAYAQFVAAYFGMFFLLVHGWDGTGYQRFFSASGAGFEQWGAGHPLEHVRAWLTSGVALTLAGMGIVLVPALLTMIARWYAEGVRLAGGDAARAGARAVLLTLASIFGLALGGAVVASVLVHGAGWLPGGAAFAVVAGVALLPRRGPAAWLAHGLLAGQPLRAGPVRVQPGGPV
jgi:hypothetical protein